MRHTRLMALCFVFAPAVVTSCVNSSSNSPLSEGDAGSLDGGNPLVPGPDGSAPDSGHDAGRAPNDATVDAPVNGDATVDAPVNADATNDAPVNADATADSPVDSAVADATDSAPEDTDGAAPDSAVGATDAGIDATPFTLTGVVSASGAPAFTNGDSTGSSFCMRLTNGSVRCMGNDGEFQLGNQGEVGTTYSPYAIPADGLTGATQVATGNSHACALAGGSTYCWGSGNVGQLAHVPTTMSPGGVKWEPVPAAVPALAGATDVTAGENVGCAVLGGSVSCWGLNQYGQVGNGTFTEEDTPVATGVAATQVVTTFHTCALTAAGDISCWGKALQGQLGNISGLTSCSGSQCNPNPTMVLEADGGVFTGATKVAVGFDYTCAIVTGGALYCFGGNEAGQLGRGTVDTNTNQVPQQVLGLAGVVVDVATGPSFACALIQGGTVQCWGDNQTNELGPNAVDAGMQSGTPVTVLTGATAIAATRYAACAIMSDSSMQCWGGDNRGELGRGTQSNTYYPTPAPVSGQY